MAKRDLLFCLFSFKANSSFISNIYLYPTYKRKNILELKYQWPPAQGVCGICKSTKEKRNIWGGGQQKLVSAGLTLRCDFSIPLPIIQTCSTTHVDTAHGSVSSGMFQTKITLFMFSNRLKFYTGMALVKMSIKSKVTVCSQSTYFLTGLIFSISITLCTQQANCGVTWKQC